MTPNEVNVIYRSWLLSAMLEDIYRGSWMMPDSELESSIKQVYALANGRHCSQVNFE